MARFTLDLRHPPALTPADQAQLDGLTDADITRGAEADPDNPPLSEAELARLRGAMRVRQVRAGAGLSQAAFARAYHISLARLRDLEQGRSGADSALQAYLTVIEREPEAVARALA